MRRETPSILLKSKKEEWLNVFFVVSPITAMIFRMMIDKYQIKTENILLISFRNSDLSMFKNESLKIKPKKIDRYLEKLFYSPSGYKILKKLKVIIKNFCYTQHHLIEVNWVLNSKSCMGHLYIEEGQASYMDWIPYDFNNLSIITD